MTRMRSGVFVATVAAVAIGCGDPAATPGGGPRAFQTGIVGSAPAGRLHPSTALADPVVRALVVDVAESPRAESDVRARLAGAAYAVDELVAIGLITLREGHVSIAFPFFSADDQRAISMRAQEDGRALAARILDQRAGIESAAAPLARSPAELRRLLFFLVGCVSLDWDGLDFTAAAGYRTSATVRTSNAAYTPWMKEDAPDLSRRGLYWGSHNAPAGAFTFTTFGDHHSVPRRGLPDAFDRSAGIGLPDLAQVVLAVRDGAAGEAAIDRATSLGAARVGAAVRMLRDVGYLDADDGRLETAITILGEDAIQPASRIRSIVGAELRAWHDERYRTLRAAFRDLTPLRQGVPFEVVYTEIWHYIFGYANLSLAESDLIADPYATGSPHRGFVPVLWWSGLAAR